jgi:6-phosphogluconolactonase
MTYHVYIAISGEGRIARFSMDEFSGELTPGEDVALSGRPAYTAIDPSGQFMYVARKENYCITTFSIDTASGDLTELGTIPIDADPAYISTDATGRWLFSASYFNGYVGVHPIGPDGVAANPPVEWLNTGMRAHCIHADPSNQFVFVPHIFREDAPNAIFQFHFDAATGALTPNNPDRCAPKGPDGPRHFRFHPTKNIIYVSNEQGCSVTVYAMDPNAGTLSPLQTISTPPEGWVGDNKCSQIRLTPDGRFLYAPNRGHDSIAEFSIDPDTGLLTALGRAVAEKIPRAFEIDPAGRFLLSAGHASGRLAVYSIDRIAGGLTRIATHELGAVPMWVTILKAT